MPSSEAKTKSARWPSPVRLAIVSSLASAVVVGIVLQSRGRGLDLRAESAHESATPERAAESFIAAYSRGDYESAARLSVGALSRKLRTRARTRRMDDARQAQPAPERSLLIEESFFLTQGRIRFTGIAAHDTRDASDWFVSLIVVRHDDGFAVEELSWPKGMPLSAP